MPLPPPGTVDQRLADAGLELAARRWTTALAEATGGRFERLQLLHPATLYEAEGDLPAMEAAEADGDDWDAPVLCLALRRHPEKGMAYLLLPLSKQWLTQAPEGELLEVVVEGLERAWVDLVAEQDAKQASRRN